MPTKSIIIITLFLSNYSYSETRSPIHLDSLFVFSDFVGVIKINSGELHDNIGAIYTGQIVEVIKGDSSVRGIEFGRISGLRIGKRYLVFLSKSKSDSIEINYAFEFETTRLNQNKDYIIRHPRPDEVIKIPTASITIPKMLKAYVVDNSQSEWSWDKINITRWVKLEELLSYLRKLLRAS